MDKYPSHFSDYPEYGQQIFDRLYAHPQDAKLRDEYIQRSLIPTNNLSQYFVDNPKPELAPGIQNPFDYRQKPFGPIITEFRETYPDLWARAIETAAESERRVSTYSDLLFAGEQDKAMTLYADLEEAYWIRAEVYDQVIRIIAPQLEAAGIDPIEVCR